MKKLQITLMIKLSSFFLTNEVIAQNKPLVCQTDAVGGLELENGQWVAELKAQFAVKAWPLGFMSGLNSSVAIQTKDPLNKIKFAERVTLRMDKFCTNNPLKTVQAFGNALYLTTK
jgi:hypothetical protein